MWGEGELFYRIAAYDYVINPPLGDFSCNSQCELRDLRSTIWIAPTYLTSSAVTEPKSYVLRALCKPWRSRPGSCPSYSAGSGGSN